MMTSKLIAFALFGGAADAIRTNSRLDLFFCSAPEDGTTPSQSSHKKVNIPNRKLGGVQYGLKNEESPEMREAASKEVDDMDEQWTDFRDRHSDRKYIQLVHQAEMSILNTAFSTLRKAVAANAATSAAVEQFSATRKLAQTRFDNITQVEASWLESAAVLFGNTAYKSDEVVFPREPYSQDSFPAKVALSEIINVDMSFLEDAPSGKLFYQPRVNNAPFHEVSKVILSERNLDMIMVVQMRYAGWVVENDKWVIPIKSKKALKDVVNMAQKYGVSTDSELIYEPLREVAKAVANGTEGQVHKMTIRDAAGEKHFAVKILKQLSVNGEAFVEDIRQWQKFPVPVFAMQNPKKHISSECLEAPEMQLTSVDGEKAVNAAIVSALVAANISNVGSRAIMITPWATHGDVNGAAQSLHPTDLFNLASDVLHANMVASLAPREIQFELSERFQHDWVKLTTSGFVINREEIEVTITAADVQQYQDVVMQSQGDRSALFIQSNLLSEPIINDASKAHLPEPLRKFAGRPLILNKNSSISKLWQSAAAENASLELHVQRFSRVSADVESLSVSKLFLRDLQGLKVIAVNGTTVDWNKNGLCSLAYFHSLFTSESTHRNDILTLQIANTTNNDIKPENIFVGDLSENQSKKVFFLADPSISGTAEYYPPETLVRTSKMDTLGENMMKYKTAGDIYAMGVTLAKTIGLSLKQEFDFNNQMLTQATSANPQEGDSTAYEDLLRSAHARVIDSLKNDIVKEYERVHVLPASEEVQRKFEAVKRVMYQMLSFEATDRSTVSALFEELHRDIQL